MKQQSLIKNSIILLIKNIITIAAPMVMYKYAAIKLGIANVGAVEFVKSLNSYFLLIAMMGINTFAIRECSKVRDNQKAIVHIASQLYAISIVTTLFSYIVLFLLVTFVEFLYPYKKLIYIYSLSIPLTTYGLEWVYNIFEDFATIALSTIVCEFIAVIGVILFVRSDQNIAIYTFLLMIAANGYDICTHFQARKHVRLTPHLSRESYQYFKPIAIIFFTNVASVIYTNADITMLGWLRGDSEVGVYSAAVKIYNVIHVMVSVGITVVIPRLTQYLHNSSCNRTEDSYYTLLNKIVRAFYIFVIFSSSTCVLYGRDMILFISGEEFTSAIKPLTVLAITLLFATGNMIIGSAILIPTDREKVILKATIAGAVLNLVLNLVFISRWGFYGAAITTLISEFLVFVITVYSSQNVLKNLRISLVRDVMPLTIGLFSNVAIYSVVKFMHWNSKYKFIFAVIISAWLYYSTHFIFRNEIVKEVNSFLWGNIKVKNKKS